MFKVADTTAVKFNSGIKDDLRRRFRELGRLLINISGHNVTTPECSGDPSTVFYRVGSCKESEEHTKEVSGAASGISDVRTGQPRLRFRLGELDDPLLVVQAFPEAVEGLVPTAFSLKLFTSASGTVERTPHSQNVLALPVPCICRAMQGCHWVRRGCICGAWT